MIMTCLDAIEHKLGRHGRAHAALALDLLAKLEPWHVLHEQRKNTIGSGETIPFTLRAATQQADR